MKKNGGETEEINNSLKVNQAEQLEALGFKMKAKIVIYQKRKANKLWKMKCHECEKKSKKKKRKNKYGVQKEELKQLGNATPLYEYPSLEFRKAVR